MTTSKRGGIYPYLGLYAEGSALNISYKAIQDRPFQNMSQLYSGKQMASNQSNLIQASNDTNIITFNGQLEITLTGVVELDKDQFIEVVEKNIQMFGLHIWYYLPRPDGTMLDLCKN